MEKSPADVLEEAADLLLIRGVCRDGSYGSSDGPRCVVGAIDEVTEDMLSSDTITDASANAYFVAHRALRATVGRNLPNWNDESTDDFEIIDTLKHVAKSLRNGES